MPTEEALARARKDATELAENLMQASKHIGALESALRTANADLKAIWIETGKGLEGLKRTEVALGLTSNDGEVE